MSFGLCVFAMVALVLVAGGVFYATQTPPVPGSPAVAEALCKQERCSDSEALERDVCGYLSALEVPAKGIPFREYMVERRGREQVERIEKETNIATAFVDGTGEVKGPECTEALFLVLSVLPKEEIKFSYKYAVVLPHHRFAELDTLSPALAQATSIGVLAPLIRDNKDGKRVCEAVYLEGTSLVAPYILDIAHTKTLSVTNTKLLDLTEFTFRNLTNLIIRNVRSGNFISCKLPVLSSLVLDGVKDIDATELSLPSLESLAIANTQSVVWADKWQYPHLKKLSLSGVSISSTALTRFLTGKQIKEVALSEMEVPELSGTLVSTQAVITKLTIAKASNIANLKLFMPFLKDPSKTELRIEHSAYILPPNIKKRFLAVHIDSTSEEVTPSSIE
ncbi:hypothetical protein NEDG_00303 [Nematocida displodere]|uniref:Internalin A n=1 Tax=Nematocida displodere TaxID=1805483 RepID=A0A177EIX3_9MICR|nr:hypothetical protein NEDG_00303 [Nematocida displodere]